MTAFLTIGVLVLVAIAIWQMTKIFELSQIKKDASQIANDNDNKYNGYLMFVFLVFIYGITIFSFYKYTKILLPKAASAHGADYDNLMLVSFVIIFIVQPSHKHYFITLHTNTEEGKVRKHY